jgi:putative ABC transport system permease protein
MILEGRESEVNQAPLVDEAIVTPEYFHLMEMTLLRGRLFSELDTTRAASVAVINEVMAQTYWPNQDPLGKHLRISRSATSWTTIVGVVADARTESLEHARVSEIYTNLYQRGGKHLAIFLRGNLDTGVIEEQVRQQVQSVDPTIPVFSAQRLTATVSASLAERRFSMEMVALFALSALLLASIGIYGVISYVVNERTREISIHLALGARHSEITRMVFREGLLLALAGAAIGLAGALIVSHSIVGLLYGIRPTDPLTFATVAVLLTGIALLACYIPARRAIRVDPMIALRHE